MRTLLALIGLIVLVVAVLMVFGFINIDQTRAARMPSVSINGGQAPSFQADVSRVAVGTANKTVAVPTVSVQKPGAPATAQ